MEVIANYDLDTCITELMSCLRNEVSVNPRLYHIMKRLRTLFDEDGDGVGDAAYQLHSSARGLIFYPSDKLMMNVVASPHMTNLLFSDEEDLLSTKNRFIKQHLLEKYNGRPSEEYIENVEDETEREELRKLIEQFDELDSTWSQPSSMSYCYLYFNLIVACAIHGNLSPSSVHDGCGTLRGGNPQDKSAESLLATAALRRAMELWTDPLVLASCGDAMAPAASLALTAVKSYRSATTPLSPLCREHELAPGLPIDRLVMTCMSELLERAGSATYSVKLLEHVGGLVKVNWERFSSVIGSSFTAPWKDLSIERRAKLALAVIHYIVSVDEDQSSAFGRNITQPYEALNNILKTLCGMQNPRDEGIYLSVWQKAAEEERLGNEGAGHNATSRAFAYYFMRGASFSCKSMWGVLDMVTLFKEFDKIPRIGKAPEDAKAKEMDECLRLARGDKQHEEMNAIWK